MYDGNIMSKTRLVFIFLCIFWHFMKAQDYIYTVSGVKMKVKMVEIKEDEIVYKNPENLDGPVNVMFKADVLLIQYADGNVKIINGNPSAYSPPKDKFGSTETKTSMAEKPDLYYLNPNLISINAISLTNGDLTVIYDREIPRTDLEISVLGAYNFNSRVGVLNAFIYDEHNKAKKLYDLGLGVNFKPNDGDEKVQFFAGGLFKYMAYNYQQIVDSTNNQYHYKKAAGSQYAVMMTSGLLFRISPTFNLKMFASYGLQINQPALQSQYVGLRKMYLGYCFGYRF